MEPGSKYITFYVEKHIAPFTICYNQPLVRDKLLGASAFVKLVYLNRAHQINPKQVLGVYTFRSTTTYPGLNEFIYVYIYIYTEREREYIYIYSTVLADVFVHHLVGDVVSTTVADFKVFSIFIVWGKLGAV